MNDIDCIVAEVEVMSSKELSELDSFKPQIIYNPNESSVDSDNKLAEGISETIDKLAKSLDLDSPESDPEKVLNTIDDITSESQKAFDLLSSKTLKTINSRARVKAMMAGNILMSKLADMVSKMDQFDYSADPMSFTLFSEKFLDFIDKMDLLSKPYNESVDESLVQMSEDKNKEKFQSQADEQVTPAQLAEYVEKLRKMK